MKRLNLVISLLILTVLFIGCGPSQMEQEISRQRLAFVPDTRATIATIVEYVDETHWANSTHMFVVGVDDERYMEHELSYGTRVGTVGDTIVIIESQRWLKGWSSPHPYTTFERL